MLPIKHGKDPLGKGLEVHLTAFSMEHLGKGVCDNRIPVCGYESLGFRGSAESVGTLQTL